MAKNNVKMTISIPEALRKRMARCPDSIVWSEIAAEAFSVEVEKHLSKPNKRDSNMSQKVVDRLKKSLEKSESQSYIEGKNAGVEWASDVAEAVALKRLAKYRQTHREDWECAFEEVQGSGEWQGNPFLYAIAAAMCGRNAAEVSFEECAVMWSHMIGNDFPEYLVDADYMRGLFDGALEVWEQFQAQA